MTTLHTRPAGAEISRPHQTEVSRPAGTEISRPVWAEISKSRLLRNLGLLTEALAAQAGPAIDAPGAALLAVVKANAYGHGAVECAPLLACAGAAWLGVTSVEEGVAVREACAPTGCDPHILVMCGLWRGEAEAVVRHRLTPVVWEPFHLDELEAAAAQWGLKARSLAVHLEVDTGMARQGVAPGERLDALLSRFTAASPLRLDGVLTHFASAEVVDSPQNQTQMEKFKSALGMIAERGIRPHWVHAGNSSSVDAGFALATLRQIAGEIGATPMVRPGLALYGYSLPLVRTGNLTNAANAEVAANLENSANAERDSTGQPGSQFRSQFSSQLQPVLAWKTRIVSLRDVAAGDTIGYSATFAARQPMRLALLPVGYADGLRRELSGSNSGSNSGSKSGSNSDSTSSSNLWPGGMVLVRGCAAPIVGRVSMDLTVVDVSAVPGAEIGDEVVLIGEQGSLAVSAEDHARLAGTIAYEILCGISDRVPRIVVA